MDMELSSFSQCFLLMKLPRLFSLIRQRPHVICPYYLFTGIIDVVMKLTAISCNKQPSCRDVGAVMYREPTLDGMGNADVHEYLFTIVFKCLNRNGGLVASIFGSDIRMIYRKERP